MSLLKRLGFYLIGLAIGLIFLAFFLNRKKAEFCYLPNCRVLKELRSKPLSYSADVSALLRSGEIDSADITKFLTVGDIDFGDSETRAKPCKIYQIEAEVNEKPMLLTVKGCDSLTQAWKLVKLH